MTYGLTTNQSTVPNWESFGNTWGTGENTVLPKSNKFSLTSDDMRYGSQGLNINSQMPGLTVPTQSTDLLGSLSNYGNSSNSLLNSAKNWLMGSPGVGGSPGTSGALSTGLSVLGPLMNTYMGMQNLKLAKQSIQDGRDQFKGNYAAQMAMTNEALSDKKASNAGLTGSSYADAQAYGKEYAKVNGVQAYKGA